ncbi:HisA/HisF-related TIM barrel protein [Actinokineospora sp. PR83]|uniref:HisA/HisF-related TIM barrel protein n=1 Tax=Actinokineospora sp. PR83 TaxID=2884908 RepID=UPI001F1E627F|nr:HisA/HisF-related TIM barrel protein [Actinokineospora sp. PR83]MCG8917331.1 HisA/HisF-related TIM barrel protein [Actinokineospora sp. PR83]
MTLVEEGRVEHLAEPWLTIGGHSFRSRLIVGIEQYDSVDVVRDVLAATGADVFITTVDPDSRRSSLLLSDLDDAISLDEFIWVGTTSFSRSRESAVRTAHILRDTMGITILKLDVRGADNLPDNRGTVEAARQLRAEGMELLPFILPDLETARALQAEGCAALRVMASPVASGRGIDDLRAVKEIIDGVGIPVVVEGGLGTAKHVAVAMELGADATLINTALIRARDPLKMAVAMRHAVAAGRLAYESGPMAETPAA